jgi:uncharacterized RmlC-like cupin family protein
VVYVVSGIFRVEYGPGGREVAEAAPGDFMLIPKNTVHREINTGSEASFFALVRVGNGEPVTNVDGPDPG